MRIRLVLVLAAVLAAMLLSVSSAQAHPCGQYPTFMQPILCRL